MAPVPTKLGRGLPGRSDSLTDLRNLVLRSRRVALTLALREGGMTTAEIAHRLGVARSTVRCYLAFPDAAPVDAARARAICECGAPVSAVGRSCRFCAAYARLRWTEERSLQALAGYRRIHGRFPTARVLDAAPAGLPSRATLRRLFGSYGEARRRACLMAAELSVPSIDQELSG